MSWGGSHNPKCAHEVAEAFHAGKSRKRGNCRTDGRTYWLFDNPIARRIHQDDICAMVTAVLEDNYKGPRMLEFSWAGWPTPTTEAHLNALGISAWKGSSCQRNPRSPTLNQKPVEVHKWYTLDDLASIPRYVAPVRRKRFVNLTMPLFS